MQGMRFHASYRALGSKPEPITFTTACVPGTREVDPRQDQQPEFFGPLKKRLKKQEPAKPRAKAKPKINKKQHVPVVSPDPDPHPVVVDLVDSDHDDDHGVSGKDLPSSDSDDSAVHMTLRLCGYFSGLG